jgi:hypothetical protein
MIQTEKAIRGHQLSSTKAIDERKGLKSLNKMKRKLNEERIMKIEMKSRVLKKHLQLRLKLKPIRMDLSTHSENFLSQILSLYSLL